MKDKSWVEEGTWLGEINEVEYVKKGKEFEKSTVIVLINTF